MQQSSSQEIAELRLRIDQIHELLAGRGGEFPVPTVAPFPAPARPAPLGLIAQLAFNIEMRRLHKAHFSSSQLSGPIWDMMLDMMLADSNGRELSASDLATGAGVPLSSGLRMIAALERLGLATRSIDDRDRRRSIVRLTDAGTERMASYFDKIGKAWQNSQDAMSGPQGTGFPQKAMRP